LRNPGHDVIVRAGGGDERRLELVDERRTRRSRVPLRERLATSSPSRVPIAQPCTRGGCDQSRTRENLIDKRAPARLPRTSIRALGAHHHTIEGRGEVARDERGGVCLGRTTSDRRPALL